MVHKFGAARVTEEKEAEPASFLPHQEKVNLEMFRAIETLGRKLERAESERDRLARRLALIESSASVDEKTGRLYLPVAMGAGEDDRYHVPAATPRWMMIASLMSSAVAFFALGVVLFREPQVTLTPKQIAILNSLAEPQMARFDSKSWKSISEKDVDPDADVLARKPTPFLPGDKELASEEKNAEMSVPPADETAMASSNDTPAQSLPVTQEKTTETAPVELTKPAVTAEPEPITEQAAAAKPDTSAAKEEVAPAPVSSVAANDAAPVSVTKTEAKEAPVAAASVAEEKMAKAAPATDTAELSRDKSLPSKLADLEKRAFDGVPEAQHDLATLYASGRLVKQNYKRAIYWFKKAAEGDIANADYNLGVMYQQGLGVQKNLASALDWYAKAANLGHPEAMYNLGIAYIQGIGTQQSIEKGVGFFKDAANAGVSQAAFNLGVLYESNFIGPINLSKALDWYQVAANEGHADAGASIERLKKQIAAKQADGTRSEDISDDALQAADMIDPSSGEETGEGDASPADEDAPAITKKPSRYKK